MEIEELVKTIDSSGAKIHNKESVGGLDENHNFNRTVNFNVGEKDYKIVWYCNLSNLYIDENTQILFDDVKCKNTWPVYSTEKSKNQLQFIYGGDVVCVLITERY